MYMHIYVSVYIHMYCVCTCAKMCEYAYRDQRLALSAVFQVPSTLLYFHWPRTCQTYWVDCLASPRDAPISDSSALRFHVPASPSVLSFFLPSVFLPSFHSLFLLFLPLILA